MDIKKIALSALAVASASARDLKGSPLNTGRNLQNNIKADFFKAACPNNPTVKPQDLPAGGNTVQICNDGTYINGDDKTENCNKRLVQIFNQDGDRTGFSEKVNVDASDANSLTKWNLGNDGNVADACNAIIPASDTQAIGLASNTHVAQDNVLLTKGEHLSSITLPQFGLGDKVHLSGYNRADITVTSPDDGNFGFTKEVKAGGEIIARIETHNSIRNETTFTGIDQENADFLKNNIEFVGEQAAPTTAAPVTGQPATAAPVTGQPTSAPTTAAPVTGQPTAAPTTGQPATGQPVTGQPTAAPTTAATAAATDVNPTESPKPSPSPSQTPSLSTPAPSGLIPTDSPEPSPSPSLAPSLRNISALPTSSASRLAHFGSLAAAAILAGAALN